ncbi:tripartite motif-containing protein 16-like [Genypterus blacodes]|uniref:tripartite motif-containing protein 16-like n=1 Tax=Genypterus blacodes TaxID=154954 RepID=UPI003F77627C
MAQQGFQLDPANFCCSICLDLLREMVIIPCGHSYCMACITRWWDTEEGQKNQSCPQCRKIFRPRPVLQVQPSRELQENICSHHDGAAKTFSSTDQQWICQLCSVDEHNSQDAAASADVDVSLPTAELMTRAQLLTHTCEITLDPNTVNKRLLLSNGNRKITHVRADQSYCDHPDRFTDWFQALSAESLSGPCYWEVKGRRGRCVTLAVAYKDINRTGDQSAFGQNEKSWSLYYYGDRFTFSHNSVTTEHAAPWSSRVGVYLDHSAGLLSFYSVSDTMTLLHRVQTTFTQPLYAGLRVSSLLQATAEVCEPW